MSIAAAESDAIWWFAERGGDLGYKAQEYNFSEPMAAAVDTWSHLETLVSRRRRQAVQRYYRQLPSMRDLAARNPAAMEILSDVYTPHAQPESLDAVRLWLAMPGSRHTVNLLPIAHRSVRLRSARDRDRPQETLVEFMAWTVSSQNARLARAIRDELAGHLEYALTVFETIRTKHEVQRGKRGLDAWVREHLEVQAAE